MKDGLLGFWNFCLGLGVLGGIVFLFIDVRPGLIDIALFGSILLCSIYLKGELGSWSTLTKTCVGLSFFWFAIIGIIAISNNGKVPHDTGTILIVALLALAWAVSWILATVFQANS